jgi:tetratricopeptide (TPR) repeat protein
MGNLLHLLRPAAALPIVTLVLAPVLLAGDAEDLLEAVGHARAGEAPESAFEGWSLERARAAAHEVRRREGNAGRWKDAEVLAAALLYTEEGVRELDSGDAAGPWFDQAHGLLEGLPDEARRRRLLSRWTLAVAARFNAAYDGRRSRDLLDAAARELPDDADVLDADARVHAAIAERPYSGLGETVRPSEEVDAVRPDLARALQLYERVLRLQPDRSEARLRRGRVLLLLRRTAEARAELEPLAAPEQGTDLACLSRLLIGAAFEHDGRYDEALTAYRAAAATGRSPQVARLAIARLLRRRGDTAGARRTVRELLAARGGAGDAWWRFQADGLGPDNGNEALLAALWQEARR